MKKKKINKNKNNMVIKQNVAIVVLSVIVLCLCIAISVQGDNKPHYTAFNDSMIQIDEVNDLKVTANIYEEQHLVVLLEPTSKKDIDVDVHVSFEDIDGKAISMDSTQATVLSDGKNLVFFDVPELNDDKYVGTIDINIETHNTEDVLKADLSKVIYQETHEVNDKGDIIFHITGQNQNDATILGLVGYIVALKDGNIVAYNSFSQDEVGAIATFDFDTEFHSMSTQEDEIVSVDYDELMIFSSFALDDYRNE